MIQYLNTVFNDRSFVRQAFRYNPLTVRVYLEAIEEYLEEPDLIRTQMALSIKNNPQNYFAIETKPGYSNIHVPMELLDINDMEKSRKAIIICTLCEIRDRILTTSGYHIRYQDIERRRPRTLFVSNS